MTRKSARFRLSLSGILIVVAIAAILFSVLSREHSVQWEQVDASFIDVDPRLVQELRKAHGNNYFGAVRVHNVGTSGPAYAAGIRQGDLLIAVHGWPFHGIRSLESAKAFLTEQLSQPNGIKFYGSRGGKLYSGYMHP